MTQKQGLHMGLVHVVWMYTSSSHSWRFLC